MEYIIRRADPDADPCDFALNYHDYPTVLHPTSVPWRQVSGWGSHRIEVPGGHIVFSDEFVGFQVIIEPDTIADEQADQWIAEICDNITQATGEVAEFLRID